MWKSVADQVIVELRFAEDWTERLVQHTSYKVTVHREQMSEKVIESYENVSLSSNDDFAPLQRVDTTGVGRHELYNVVKQSFINSFFNV